MCTARTGDLEKQMLRKRTSKENDDVLIGLSRLLGCLSGS
jgi:hypothetical protein